MSRSFKDEPWDKPTGNLHPDAAKAHPLWEGCSRDRPPEPIQMYPLRADAIRQLCTVVMRATRLVVWGFNAILQAQTWQSFASVALAGCGPRPMALLSSELAVLLAS